MNRTLSSLCVAGGLLLGGQAMADSPLIWQDNSLTYLYGQDYKVDAPIQQTFTFEHASGWTWGDVFIFVDQINFNGKGNDDGHDNSTLYGEISPRLSIGKLTGLRTEYGLLKDVLIAATYEGGEGDVEAYLLGPGFDFNIPGFNYFSLNIYYREPDGDRVPTGAIQITPTWSLTIPLGPSDILFDGYMDWVFNNRHAGEHHPQQSDYHANVHFNPQLSYDVGKALGYEAKHLYVGLEYDYWSDKYGIKDSHYFHTDQNTASFMVKYHF